MFGNVIVRCGIQTLDPVFDSRALGQYQYGQAGFLKPQVAEDTDSVNFWQIQVQDHDVIFDFCGCGAGLLAVRYNIHGIVLAFETLTDEFSQCFIIFCNKNSHNLNRP